MNKFEYKNLTPFKWFVLENFPFIEADFDALTEWQLFCKLGKEMNKIINSENTLGTQMENVTNAFIELQNYVNNYLSDLNVQEQVNNKLNQMASDGTLAEIINQDIFNELNKKIDNLYNNRSILLSDSYFDYSPDVTIPDGQKYWQLFFKMENITDYQGFNAGGIGFYQKVGDVNFLQLLKNNSDNIQNKNTVKNIFVFGGYNDAFDNNTTKLNIKQSISDFVAYCKETYPNAKVFIGEIGYDTNFTNDGTTRRNKINNIVVPAYSDTAYNSDTPYIYLPNLEYCLHNRDYMSTDGIHPNILGHNALANAIHSAYHNGFNQLPFNEEYVTALPIDGNTQEHTAVSLYVKNDIPTKNIRFNQFIISFTENYPTLSNASGTSVCKITNSKTIIPVYDIPIDCHLLLSFTDNTYIIVPGKITFAQNGDLTVTAYELNESKSGWKELPNVKYIQAFDFDFTCSMNVL